MGIKRIKTQSQRITSSGYLKKIQNQRTAAGSGYFKKTSQNCRVSRKLGKEEPCRFLGGYFTFTIWDLGFRTSTDRLTELTEIMKKSPTASPASPSPTPQNSRHKQTNRTKWINILDVHVFQFANYLTLRSFSSLTNPQNREMSFCENMESTCWKSS
jgi:hypothetical protein